MGTVAPGMAAPLFTLLDTRGEVRSLAEALRRGPVLVVFFKIHCPTSRQLFPYLERLHRAYADTTAQVWGVALDPADAVRAFAERYQITFPLLSDYDAYAVSRAYDPAATPTLVLIEPGGQIAYVADGFRTAGLNTIAVRLGAFAGRPPTLVAPDAGGPPAR